MQMVWIRLLAPKSPSFTFPEESLRMLAPGGRRQCLALLKSLLRVLHEARRRRWQVEVHMNVAGYYRVVTKSL